MTSFVKLFDKCEDPLPDSHLNSQILTAEAKARMCKAKNTCFSLFRTHRV